MRADPYLMRGQMMGANGEEPLPLGWGFGPRVLAKKGAPRGAFLSLGTQAFLFEAPGRVILRIGCAVAISVRIHSVGLAVSVDIRVIFIRDTVPVDVLI